MTTSRPTTHNDLYSHQRENVKLATISKDLLEVEDLDLIAPLIALLKAARDAGFIVKNDGEYTIERERTTEELDDALKIHQRLWDTGKELYEQGLQNNFQELANGKLRASRFYVDRYLSAEGIPPIDWAKYEETE